MDTTTFTEKQRISVFNNIGLTQVPGFKEVRTWDGRTGYTYPNDARLRDQRGMELILDKPAQSGEVDMDSTVYINNQGYGGVYNSYCDINNGQITYYADSSTSQPFLEPVYTLTSNVEQSILIDPMDSYKPQYRKIPVTTTFNSVSRDQATRDQLMFREDLMSRQQSLYNRTRIFVNLPT